MKDKIRSILTLLIAISVVMASIAVPALAAGSAVEQISESEYIITSNGTYRLSDGSASVVMLAEESVTSVTGGNTITANGTYQLAEDATGIISVAAGVTQVTIIGNGAQWEQNAGSSNHGYVYSTANEDLGIDCSAAPGITLTIRNAYISNSGVSHNVLNFAGTGNTLIFDGTVILDHDNGAQGYASIHVPTDASLTIRGTTGSHAYLYKSEQAAGIGGNSGEACGTVTFGVKGGANDFYLFMKGSKQGAVIGNGSNCSAKPGNITFHSGIYNLMSVSRGAIISGSAGASSKDAGNVFVTGGLLNLNVDFSGAAIGGGGYSSGNDKGGGVLYVTGGSIRTYIDSNAVSSWSSSGVTTNGVNDTAITAARLNAADQDVFLLTVDTSGITASTYTIGVDGTTYYTGERYSYSYYKEDENRDTDGDGLADLATTPSGTPGNWVSLEEPCFYLYVTGEDHTVTVNGTKMEYLWDPATGSFTPGQTATIRYGDVNGDGNVNAVDAAIVYRIANSKLTATGDQLTAGDVNGDGVLNAIDAALIYRYANSKLSKFPVE